jgi:recombination protein RecR
MRSSPPIDRLVDSLKRLPGIGEKSATRLAFFLLGAPDVAVQELAPATSAGTRSATRV